MDTRHFSVLIVQMVIYHSSGGSYCSVEITDCSLALCTFEKFGTQV